MATEFNSDQKILDISEQLIELKLRLGMVEDDLKEANTQNRELRRSLSELSRIVTEIHLKLDRQKSFVGGIIFVISAIWAVALTFKDSVFNILGK